MIRSFYAELSRLLRRFGWLPISQAIVFVVSTTGFAVLARILGPESYAKFAFILLVFTVTSLLVDLSPQGFALVHGVTVETLGVARKIAVLSSALGAVLLGILMFVSRDYVPSDPLTIVDFGVLLSALLAQFAMQPSRASIVASREYWRVALTDIAGTVAGVAAAIVLALSSAGGIALVSQLAIGAIVKAVFSLILSRRIEHSPAPTGFSLGQAIRFGLRVVPLNLASYLGRSLDSGLLPGLVPAAAAASYSRSYQIVVVPITQMQLSVGPAILERFSLTSRSNSDVHFASRLKLWTWLQGGAFVFALLVIAFSGVIQILLFGPGWQDVNVTISAMACCLPGMAVATFGTWSTQVDGGLSRALVHLLVVLLGPASVLLAAWAGDYGIALLTLVVVGGLIQPQLLSALHAGSLKRRHRNTALILFGQWLICSTLFVAVATLSGFWK